MRTREIRTGRHRLGSAGRVHCVFIPAVARYLRENRRSWFTVFVVPAQHSFAAKRHRPVVPRVRIRWIPAPAG
ncbi:hypothetical protein [Nocardia flavorosea]|uniref:hypothetical protein n=1 Tax=Nocardia flavorosea TaxID=53429 RepID=UPI000A0420C9|nr:hypothetical protein [Nocardia flavorosea]